MAAGEDRILIVCDVSKHSGAKKYGSIRDPSALRDYITRHQKTGLGHPNLYEGLSEGLPTKLYADIDLRTASRVEGDFERYKRHMDEVRDTFLADVLGIPPESIQFECSEAHGDAADGGYKWSIHELLRGYYLEDFHAATSSRRPLSTFRRTSQRTSCTATSTSGIRPDPQRGPKLIWDPSVFAKFKCFRTLYSQKRAPTGPCCPSREAPRSWPTTWWASTSRRSSRL
jgi:hypothetical protein